ncbi:CrcB family protein [Saccharopolyspora halophila]|uniref:Fluoride-specific ion channel FluC n=1 Tax=Saccharopolyspora halophila TaxID=405551 RepID=A0ABN3FQC5_9PSEU
MAFPPELRATRKPPVRAPLDVLGVVAAGGAIGSLLRHGAALTWPGPGATLLVNVLGCLGIGVLMYTITEVVTPHRLLRPFLGVGLLGGFTTFSTYVTDAFELARQAHPALALAYLAGTAVSCLLAVFAGVVATRLIVRALKGVR